ncbi:MAG: PBP1A family penicillin-binding protein [Microcystaceae cyanobacterium]
MASKPPSPPQSPISQLLTQAVQQLGKNKSLKLKKGANVAKLYIRDGNKPTKEIYSLVGDRYIIGRSSRSSDIVISNTVVSQTHCVLHRDPKRPRHFYLKDDHSTNGTYRGKRRIKKPLPLHHGDTITLGPPELRDTVKLTYRNPAPLWMQLTRFSLYGVTGFFFLVATWVLWQWSKVPVRPLPSGVSGPVIVYARDGQTPLTSVEKRPHRDIEDLSEFSPYLPKAVIASEDSRFYWHLGVDPIGIARAILINAKTQETRQGASTLTQQLARSLFTEVGRENTAERKIREILVALKLETVYSKDYILKAYLNRVYLGVGSYGFEDAAQFYFEKSARDLDIAEAATLVAILPAPNAYNPVSDYNTALSLRNRVISRMAQLGMISDLEALRARRSRINVSPKAQQALSSTIAPYFYSYVFQELRQLLGEELAKEGNFIVETGLDTTLQAKAEQALKKKVETDGSRLGFSQGAMVTLDTTTGEILAMVGGVNYQKSQFNRVTQSKLQPASTFKLFAYAAAVERGMSPNKLYSCQGLRWQGQMYRPCERSGRAAMDMVQGFAKSENAIALRVAQEVGLQRVIQMAQRLGIQSPLQATPGLVLGESEVKVLELTGAYGAIANNGVWQRPHGITQVLDGSDCTNPNDKRTCRVIYEASEDNNQQKQVLSPQKAHTMLTMMREVIKSGTGSNAKLGRGEGGKTGTTNDSVDLWFVGMIPQDRMVTGIWLGNDQPKPTRGSSAQAASLWKDYME